MSLSPPGEGETADAWDRIVVMENSLKYWQDIKDGRKVANVGTSATAFAKAARR